MSYSLYFNSFDEKTADEKWDNFDALANNYLGAGERTEELNQKLAEYPLDDREIYDPIYKKEFKDEIAKKNEIRNEIWRELHEIEAKNDSLDIFRYIKAQEPIGSDSIIGLMVNLDLKFGGEGAYLSSSMDPIFAIEATLMILFPEINFSEFETLKKEDCIFLAEHFDELRARYEAHGKELLENKDIEVDNENELWWWVVDFRNYMRPVRKVVIDIAQKDAKLYVWSDGDGWPNDEFLERRAKDHIDRFKNHPLMKIPLQNYGK